MQSTGFVLGDKQAYYVETFILDASTAGMPVAHVAAHSGNPAVSGVAGNTLAVEPGYRSLLVFFKSETQGGGYFTVDGVAYRADMGGSRGDPMLAYSITDENSVFVAEPVITAYAGAVVEVQIQREVRQ